MRTLLSDYCKSQGWQGGTIWEVFEHAAKHGKKDNEAYSIGKCSIYKPNHDLLNCWIPSTLTEVSASSFVLGLSDRLKELESKPTIF